MDVHLELVPPQELEERHDDADVVLECPPGLSIGGGERNRREVVDEGNVFLADDLLNDGGDGRVAHIDPETVSKDLLGALQVLGPTQEQVVNDDDLVRLLLGDPIDEMAANESGSAGHQNVPAGELDPRHFANLLPTRNRTVCSAHQNDWDARSNRENPPNSARAPYRRLAISATRRSSWTA